MQMNSKVGNLARLRKHAEQAQIKKKILNLRFRHWPIKFLLGLSALISPLHAEWDPEKVLTDFDTAALDLLIDVDFLSLKGHVIDKLRDSWCSREKVNLLMDLVYLTRPKVCVEIGAFTGSSVLPVAATLGLLQFGAIYAVDAWSNQTAVRYLADNDPNKFWWSNVNMKDVRRMFDQMIYSWHLNAFCAAIQEPSEKAVTHLPEIDFLHLDGDYSEIGSCLDVELYLPKVKSGGYILLSNVFVMVHDMQPKSKAFCELFNACDVVCEIDMNNTFLFRKL